jgi:hypothetical protein
MPSSTLQHCVRRRCTHAQMYIARARGEGSDGQIRRKTLTCRTHILDAWPRPLPRVKYVPVEHQSIHEQSNARPQASS